MQYFLYGLALLLTGLKLAGIIDMWWVFVLLPAYGPFLFGWGCVLLAVLGLLKLSK